MSVIENIHDTVSNYFDHGVFTENRTIYLAGTVDEDFAAYTIKALNILEHHDREAPIRIICNNIGGSEYDGLAVYDYIKRVSKYASVICDVYGSCMSMAVYILQAASVRRLSPNSRMMIHCGTREIPENHEQIVKRWAKFFDFEESIFIDLLLNRIREKHPKFRRDKLRQMLLFDTIFTAQQAIDLGLADEIVGE